MLAGLGTTICYAAITHPFFGGSMKAAWFDINPISAGIFGIPVGFAVLIVVSLLTPAPDAQVLELVERVRYPSLEGNSRAEPT
jgi:cation/acetate symporter